MAEPPEQVGEPEGACPERAQLWHRLLAGQPTEVYVTGFERTMGRHLPQTLGLEPIASLPHLRAMRDEARDRTRVESIARQLSAERRWIAGGGPWYWDRHFAARAQIILIFDLYDISRHRENDIDFGLHYQLAQSRRAARVRREGREYTEEDAWHTFLTFTASAARRGDLTSMEYAAYEVRERHLAKTFVIINRQDRRRLRAVRAVPNG